MISLSTIKTALYGWLSAVVSSKVIFADQAGPRPATTYFTIKILNMQRVGFDDRKNLSAIGVQTIVGDRIIVVSIEAMGNNAFDEIQKAWDSLYDETRKEALRTAGLVPNIVRTIDDLTGLMDTEWEPRYHFDVNFSMSDTYTDTGAGLIEHAEIEAEITNGQTHIETWPVN